MYQGEKMNDTTKTTAFDIAEHLETEKDIKMFLNGVAKTGDSSDIIHALSIAARAKGMSTVAKDAGVTRASLYKSLSETGSPKFETINKVANALGSKLVFA
jgi:probable addiction module antidote protein